MHEGESRALQGVVREGPLRRDSNTEQRSDAARADSREDWTHKDMKNDWGPKSRKRRDRIRFRRGFIGHRRELNSNSDCGGKPLNS